MQQKTFGNSELMVTPIGLGLAALGRPGYINLEHADDLKHNYEIAAMQSHAYQVLDAAWENGVRYFDAARSYGRAESFLGAWLADRRIKPNQVSVGSKWGYRYSADWQVEVEEGGAHEVKEHSMEMFQLQMLESRAFLGDYLDLYQIHSATLESKVLENEELLEELTGLRERGILVGLTVSGEKQAQVIERALEVEIDGKRLFSSVQATWNLLERSTTDILNAAHQAGVGVIIKEALANGRLTSRNQETDFAQKRARLERMASERDTTIDALALAAVLRQPFVDVVLSGAARVEHLESNMQALGVVWNDAIESQTADLVEDPQQYWHIRSQLAWN
jgi:aryl-alcohol dehydrogenase-like predicted oxidoreductase